MPGTYTSILLHIVFATKRRTPWLAPDIRARVHEFLGGIVRSERGSPLAIGGVEDHVHLLVRWRTDGSIADLLRNVKARSSLWIHQTFPGLRDFAWQEGYTTISVSPSGKERVEHYIRNQEEHHRTRSFKAELVALLRACAIEYDPRYVFDDEE